MQKLLIFFLLCLSVCVQAAPWGAMKDYDVPVKKGCRPGDRYLLSRILSGQPVRIYLTVEDEIFVSSYEEKIADNYAQWFSEPARLIRRAEREEEFADILPILDRGIRVQFVTSGQERDIDFVLLPWEDIKRKCGSGTAGCYARQDAEGIIPPCIYLPKDKWWRNLITGGQSSTKRIGLHEVGHSLGLSDQYKQARDNNSHPVYSTYSSSKSTMNMNKTLTCDDADGIINLLDITRGTSRGGRRGWRSLCKNSDTYYVMGRPVSRGPYFIYTNSKGLVWILQTYEGNKRHSRRIGIDLWGGFSDFAPQRETVLQKDGIGRPVLARRPGGEEIYYSYVYDKTTRLVVRGDDVLQVKIDAFYYPGNRLKRRQRQQIIFFGENGRISILGYLRPVKSKGKEGVAFYVNGLGIKDPYADIEMEFNAQGEVVRTSGFWQPARPVGKISSEKSAASQPEREMAYRQRRFPEKDMQERLEGAAQKQWEKKKADKLAEWYLKQE